MTPKEKAHELFNQFNDATIAYDSGDHTAKGINDSIITMVNESKRCALIAVNEILHVLFQHHKIDYWKEVKAEIERL